jgi:hypothetical protein
MRNNTTPATERQVSYLRSLVRDRVVPVAGHTPHEAMIVARCEDALEAEQTRFISKSEASEAIDFMLRQPRRPVEDQSDQPEIGVYVMPDSTIVLAKPNKAGTNVYTKRWVETCSDRITEDDDFVKGDWEYDPSLKRQLSSARKMTMDEAKAFLVRYGRCVRCSRRLKVGQSVERGLGPVCVKYFSLA